METKITLAPGSNYFVFSLSSHQLMAIFPLIIFMYVTAPFVIIRPTALLCYKSLRRSNCNPCSHLETRRFKTRHFEQPSFSCFNHKSWIKLIYDKITYIYCVINKFNPTFDSKPQKRGFSKCLVSKRLVSKWEQGLQLCQGIVGL